MDEIMTCNYYFKPLCFKVLSKWSLSAAKLLTTESILLFVEEGLRTVSIPPIFKKRILKNRQFNQIPVDFLETGATKNTTACRRKFGNNFHGFSQQRRYQYIFLLLVTKVSAIFSFISSAMCLTISAYLSSLCKILPTFIPFNTCMSMLSGKS